MSDSPEQVNGATCFWLLIALACAAITQPSIGSRKRKLFDGPMDPLRCFPAVCFFDAIFDILNMSWYLEARNSTLRPMRQADNPVWSLVPDLKTAMFVLGNLYATIYIFALRGVLTTQLCAATYFSATTTGLLVDLFGLKSEEYDFDENLQNLIVAIFTVLQIIFETALWITPYASQSEDFGTLGIGIGIILDMILYLLGGGACFEINLKKLENVVVGGCLILMATLLAIVLFANRGGLLCFGNAMASWLIVVLLGPGISYLIRLYRTRGTTRPEGEQPVLATIPTDKGILEIFNMHVFVWSTCLFTLDTTVWYYFSQFRSDGTEKPGWTSIFG